MPKLARYAALLTLLGSTACNEASVHEDLVNRLAPSVDALCDRAIACTPNLFEGDINHCRIPALVYLGSWAIWAADHAACEVSLGEVVTCISSKGCVDFPSSWVLDNGCPAETTAAELACTPIPSGPSDEAGDPSWLVREPRAAAICRDAAACGISAGFPDDAEERFQTCASIASHTRATSSHVYGHACGEAYLDLVACRIDPTCYPCNLDSLCWPGDEWGPGWSLHYGGWRDCSDEVAAAREVCNGFGFLPSDGHAFPP